MGQTERLWKKSINAGRDLTIWQAPTLTGSLLGVESVGQASISRSIGTGISPRSRICGLGILSGLRGKALLPNSWVSGKGTSRVYMKTVPQILGSVAVSTATTPSLGSVGKHLPSSPALE